MSDPVSIGPQGYLQPPLGGADSPSSPGSIGQALVRAAGVGADGLPATVWAEIAATGSGTHSQLLDGAATPVDAIPSTITVDGETLASIKAKADAASSYAPSGASSQVLLGTGAAGNVPRAALPGLAASVPGAVTLPGSGTGTTFLNDQGTFAAPSGSAGLAYASAAGLDHWYKCDELWGATALADSVGSAPLVLQGVLDTDFALSDDSAISGKAGVRLITPTGGGIATVAPIVMTGGYTIEFTVNLRLPPPNGAMIGFYSSASSYFVVNWYSGTVYRLMIAALVSGTPTLIGDSGSFTGYVGPKHHVCATMDNAANIALYIDGVAVYSAQMLNGGSTPVFPASQTGIVLGTPFAGVTTGTWNGSVRDLRYRTGVLTPSQVRKFAAYALQ